MAALRAAVHILNRNENLITEITMTQKLPIIAVLGGTGKEGPGLALR
jgi:hypothetical protein